MSTSSENQNTSREQNIKKVAALIKDNKICMLTTVDAHGKLVSRPMGVVDVEFDGDLWFFSHADNRKIGEVQNEPHVNVAFASKASWVSVAGNVEVVPDLEKRKQLWSSGLSAWFPEGPEDSNVVLLKVEAESAEYWDTPGAIVTSLLSFAKVRLTGKPY